MTSYLIGFGLAAILAALALAGVFMLKDGRNGKPKSDRMMRALALRVALSVALFVCILVGHWAGWFQPTGIPLGR